MDAELTLAAMCFNRPDGWEESEDCRFWVLLYAPPRSVEFEIASLAAEDVTLEATHALAHACRRWNQARRIKEFIDRRAKERGEDA